MTAPTFKNPNDVRVSRETRKATAKIDWKTEAARTCAESHDTPPPDDWSDLDDTSLVPTGKTARQLDKPAPDQYARTDVASGLSLGSRASTTKTVNQVAQFKCDACNGSGRFIRGYNNPRDYGPCNKCKGTGKLKTDSETRTKRKKAREDAKFKQKADYILQQAAEYDWVRARCARFEFAASMYTAVHKYGSWTDGQLAAIRKCIAQDAEREKQRQATKEAAPVITGEGFDRMLITFARARASGLKWPKLRIEPYVFALAGERSKYAGKALFVKHNNDGYLGRIDLEGRWFPSGAGRGHDEEVRRICQDPLAAAVLHGKQTGHCACCGLELTNEESVRLGIGPVCREKWGL